MIVIENLTKSFHNQVVLKNISLNIRKGKVTGIIGANGSGKTTLMRIISTILQSDSGKIFIDDLDISKDQFLARKVFGLMLGGDCSLYDKLTAYENIYFYAKLQNVDPKKIDDLIIEMAKKFNMTSYLYRQVSSFSRGMRQKVLFAKTTIHNPSLLLLDEPSTGLDIDSIIDIHNFILNYKKAGNTVVITSHNMNELEKLCEDLVLLDHGRIIAADSVENLKQRTGTNSIEEIYKYFVDGIRCKK